MPPPVPPPKRSPLRLLAAMADLASGIACLVVWVNPFAFGPDSVKTIVLMMLMEFLLVHGAGFFHGMPALFAERRAKAVLSALGLAAFYLLFVVAFSLAFGEWWPLWLFGWLMIGKLLWIASSRRVDGAARDAAMATWGFSVAAYLAAVFAGILLPLPRLGLTADVVAGLGLPGSGEWVERPQTAVAGMAIYFLLLAGFKWWLATRPGPGPADQSRALGG